MLKEHKNALFQEIQRAGLNVVDFKAEMEDGDFFIFYLPVKYMYFAVKPKYVGSHYFQYCYAVFTGTVGTSSHEWLPEYPTVIGHIQGYFRDWLNTQVKTAITEELVPDLWEQAQTASESGVQTGKMTDTDTEPFTAEEQAQIKLSISTFRLLIQETFKPTQDQLEVINQRLDYLSKAVERLNRFDWKGTLIQSVIGIGINLTLDTERGRQLWGLVQVAFANIHHLLQATGHAAGAS